MPMKFELSVVLTIATVGTAALPLGAQPCQPYWSQGFPSVSNNFVGLITYDDGAGPALFAIWGLSQHIYRWRDGDAGWTLIESGMPPNYRGSGRLYVLDAGLGPRLYNFIFVYNGVPELGGRFMVWNGQSWEQAFAGIETGSMDGFVSGNVGDGQAIYGVVNTLYPQGYVGRWAADHWVQIGPTVNSLSSTSVLATAAGTHLYANGDFPNCPHFFAMWDGQQWVSSGDMDSPFLSDPVAFDDGSGLAAYGHGGVTVGSTHYAGLMKFDGQHWTILGHYDPQSIQVVRGAPMFDDGHGPGMFIWGAFTSMGGVAANSIARYGLLDHTWSALGSGLGDGGDMTGVAALPTRRGPSLFALGSFTHAGGGVANHTAQYVGCPNCYANCDLSTTPPLLNVNDFVCFLYKFVQRVPEANCDNNASIDVNDFVCFLSRFAAGCP